MDLGSGHKELTHATRGCIQCIIHVPDHGSPIISISKPILCEVELYTELEYTQHYYTVSECEYVLYY